jgi:hypothetical protein
VPNSLFPKLASSLPRSTPMADSPADPGPQAGNLCYTPRMFESHREKLAPRQRFVRRQILVALAGFGALVVMLGIGIAGYHWIGELGWVDSFLNASMILGGMGPVDPLPSDAAKIFASVYALLSGVVFISAMAVILSPAVHRALHRFHLDGGDKGG